MNTRDTKAIVDDVDTLDLDATDTRFWRTKPAGEATGGWECSLMVWSVEANAWLSSTSFTGRTAPEARAQAAKSVCSLCRWGDCFDPRHQ